MSHPVIRGMALAAAAVTLPAIAAGGASAVTTPVLQNNLAAPLTTPQVPVASGISDPFSLLSPLSGTGNVP